MSACTSQETSNSLVQSLDSDFLGQHLESLLSRQPESSRQSTNPRATTDDPFASPFTPQRRTSITSNSSNSTKKNGEDQLTPSISSRLAGHGSLTSIDNAFGSLSEKRRAESISSSMTSPTLKATSISAAHDIPEETSHRSIVPVTKASYSICTSFGKKRMQPQEQSISSFSSRVSHHQRDSISDAASSAVASSKDSCGLELCRERRASDGTENTGITTPLASSEPSSSSLEKEMLDAEDIQDSPPSSSIDASVGEKSNDQTTWARFREGGVIEPPEAEDSDCRGLGAASWVEGVTSKTKSEKSRYTSMTSRRTPPSASGKSIVSLIPFGEDGRTFRFVAKSPPTAIMQSSSPSDESDDNSSALETPKDSLKQSRSPHLDGPWQVGKPSKLVDDVFIQEFDGTVRVSDRL